MKPILLSLALIIFSATVFAQSSDFSPVYKTLIDTSKGKGKAMLRQCSRVVPQNVTGYWNIRDKEVTAMENNFLQVCALRSAKDCGSEYLGRFAYQYSGLIINGKKFIYVNALKLTLRRGVDDEYKDWKTIPFTICEGGENYWGVLFDVENNSFKDLRYNSGSVPDDN